MEKPPPGNFAYIIYIGIAVFLLMLSALFSISESSLLGINKLRLHIKKKSGDKKAVRVAKLLEKKDVLINTLLAANDLVNIFFSSLLTLLALSFFGDKGIGIATIGATVLLLIFGEIIPKTISTKNPDAISYALSFFITITVAIFKPVAIFFTTIAHSVLHIFGVKQKKNLASFSEEDIKTVLDIGFETGVIEKDENIMMNKVFRFTDYVAQEIMIPRPKIISIPYSASYDEIIQKAKSTKLTRFPVYKEDIDHIVGVLYVKDLLPFVFDKEGFLVYKVMRPPVFILGTKKMSSVQEVLAENNQSLAIIIDEYSGTDGILTLEDIAKKIFGYDASVENISEEQKAKDIETLETDGSILLDALSEKLNVSITSEMSDTLGGWIEEKLDLIPNENDFVVHNGYQFIVTEMDGHRIKNVLIKKIKTEAENDSNF